LEHREPYTCPSVTPAPAFSSGCSSVSFKNVLSLKSYNELFSHSLPFTLTLTLWFVIYSYLQPEPTSVPSLAPSFQPSMSPSESLAPTKCDADGALCTGAPATRCDNCCSSSNTACRSGSDKVCGSSIDIATTCCGGSCPDPVPSGGGGGAAPTQSPTKPSTSGGGGAPSPTSSPVAPSPTCPSCGTAPASQCNATNTNGDAYFPSSRDATITIDGNMTDWSTVISSCNVSMPMYNAGEPDQSVGNYVYVSDAYTNYDCSNNILCILVKARAGYRLDPDLSEMWLKVYAAGSSDQIPINKQMIYDNTNTTEVIGWEGCYNSTQFGSSSPAGCFPRIQIHANWCEVDPVTGTVDVSTCGSTTSTGKIQGSTDNSIGIDLDCDCSTPISPISTGTGTESMVVSVNELKNGIEGSPEDGGTNGTNISMIVVGVVASICGIALFVSKYKRKGNRNRNGNENLTADQVILSHSLPGPNVQRFAIATVVDDEDYTSVDNESNEYWRSDNLDSASIGKRIQGKGGGESLQSMKELFRQNVVNESASRSVSGMEDQEQPAQYSNHHHKYCPASKRMAAASMSPKKRAATKGEGEDSLSCANDIAGFELVLERRDSGNA